MVKKSRTRTKILCVLHQYTYNIRVCVFLRYEMRGAIQEKSVLHVEENSKIRDTWSTDWTKSAPLHLQPTSSDLLENKIVSAAE